MVVGCRAWRVRMMMLALILPSAPISSRGWMEEWRDEWSAVFVGIGIMKLRADVMSDRRCEE